MPANVTSAAQNSVALGSSSVADRAYSIAVGSSKQQRQIIYVAKGTSDTDAVNVSQLKAAVSAFGGDATVGADGSIVAPSYVVNGKTLYNVGDAIEALKDGGGIIAAPPKTVTTPPAALAEREDFLPRPEAFSCTATHVPVDSFQTDLYALFILCPD